jgi:hypothetical protein
MFRAGVKKATLVGALLCLCIPITMPLSTSALSLANNSLNVQLSPLPIELSTKPGSSVTTALRVRNAGASAEELKVSLNSVTQTGTSGTINIGSFASNNALPSWVHFSQDTFNAPAGQWISDNMTINVPKTAAFGYAFGVQFSLAHPTKAQKNKTGVQGAADVFVLLNAVAPGEKAEAQVASFKATHAIYEYLPATFNVEMHNSGNVYTAPYGNIFIDKGNKQIASLNVNKTLGNILPGSNRIYSSSWSDGFPLHKDVLDVNGQQVFNAKGKAETKLVWNLANIQKFRFGHYTAHLIMVYNNGTTDVPVTASLGFWVIPWKIVLIFLVILALICFAIYSIFKNIRGNKPPKNKSPRGPKTPKSPKSPRGGKGGGKAVDYRRREVRTSEQKRRPISRYPSH